jgi:hypothetical protein
VFHATSENLMKVLGCTVQCIAASSLLLITIQTPVEWTSQRSSVQIEKKSAFKVKKLALKGQLNRGYDWFAIDSTYF